MIKDKFLQFSIKHVFWVLIRIALPNTRYVFMEKYVKLSQNCHQILTISVSMGWLCLVYAANICIDHF